MKLNALASAIGLAVILTASVASAQVSPSGYVTNSTIAYGQSTTFVRDGTTTNAYAWTEATLWNPDSTYTALGHNYDGLPYSQTITPSHGAGTYWIQYRLVDEFYNYEDQWISITVTAVNHAPSVIGYAYAYYDYWTGEKSYSLSSWATDQDGNLVQHYIAFSNPYSPSSYTWVSGGFSDYKNYSSLVVPYGQVVVVYFVAIDSDGYMSYDLAVLNGY